MEQDLERIQKLEAKAAEAELAYNQSKAETSHYKKLFEKAVYELRTYIRQSEEGQEALQFTTSELKVHQGRNAKPKDVG